MPPCQQVRKDLAPCVNSRFLLTATLHPRLQATGGVAGSAKKNLQDALLGVLRSSEPAALPWRPKLLKALTSLGAGDAAQALVAKLDRQAVKGDR